MEKTPVSEKYLFFSSLELIDFFYNNLVDKNLKTQVKRIFEMARVFMGKKGFSLEDIYSLLVMVKDMDQRPIVNEVIKLYFREGLYPIRVIVQTSELEDTAGIEIEFSAYKGEKRFLNTGKGHLPTGPFSQGVILDDYVHCSGVRPLDPCTQRSIEGDLKQKVKQCLENLKVILESAGTGLERTYSFMVYLPDLELLPEIEDVFAQYSLTKEDILLEVTKVERLNEGHELEISCSAYLR